jgi:hypothetical protein
VSISRTPDELSIVCAEEAVPLDVRRESRWRCLRVAGTIDFGVVGVLASLTAALAGARLSVFALSTFDTDYLLVTPCKAWRVRFGENVDGAALSGTSVAAFLRIFYMDRVTFYPRLMLRWLASIQEQPEEPWFSPNSLALSERRSTVSSPQRPKATAPQRPAKPAPQPAPQKPVQPGQQPAGKPAPQPPIQPGS